MNDRSAWLRTIVPPAGVFIVAALSLEVGVRVWGIPAYLVPPPSDVLRVLGVPSGALPQPVVFAPFPAEDSAELWRAIADTAINSIAGLVFSTIAGLAIAIAMSSSAWIRRAVYPYAILFQTVPIIAIAPLLVIWTKTQTAAIITSAFIVSLFPIITNALIGLRSTDPALVDLFRLHRASQMQTMLKLRLPFALPSILTGVRVAAGLSVVGAIVGEFIAGGGIGGVMDSSRTQQRVDKVFAGLLLSSLLGLSLLGIVNLISRVALRHWHPSERSG